MLTSLQALLRLASLRWLSVFVCALATLLSVAGTASALEAAQTKTRVWGFDFAEHNSVGLFQTASSGKHQGNCSARTQVASASLPAARGVPQVAKAIDPNKLHHIFGQAKHKLGPLLEKFGGSQEGAFRAVEGATQTAVKNQGLTGVFKTTVEVGGQNVGVKGTVIDSTAHIGSFWIPYEAE